MAATHKTTLSILAYAALEWILILMLFFNSIFSYLIRKFATYYSLKPPCFWCSTIDHILEPNNNGSPYRNLICEAHAAEFLNLYYGPQRPKQTTEPWCSCSSMNFQPNSVNRLIGNASKFKSDNKENEIVQAMNLPVENKSGHLQVFDHIIPLEWTDSSTSCSRCSSLNGDENMVVNDEDQVVKEEDDTRDKAVTIDSLVAELRAERLVVCGLYIELDEERNASAIAANQALAMITKLQEEKIALQIESVQNKRMRDEQAEYDHEVLQLLNELVMKLVNDKIELENELDVYEKKLCAYEGKNKVKMTLCGASCSITKESLVDDTNILDLKNLRALEESVVDFEVQGLWILDELKDLDETLTTLTNDLDEHLVGKANLEGEEDHGCKGNRVNRVFEVIDEVEASHAPWSRCSP